MKRLLWSVLALAVFSACLAGCPAADGPPLPPAEPDLILDDLVGSMWTWPALILTFTTGDIVELSRSNDDAYLLLYRYTYDNARRTGRIEYDQTLNGENVAENPAHLGNFAINPAYSVLNFAQYKDYPHGASFDRLLE
jgi:hypothetical protein